MIRNLKVLGLALMAVFAFSAVAASAASAVTTDGELTSDGRVFLDGTEIVGKVNGWTFFGESGECAGSTYDGEKIGGGFITTPVTEITVLKTPSSSCTATGPHKATVTMNGCDWVAHIGETIGGVADQYHVTIDKVCPVGKAMEIHVYLATNNENVVACTLKIKGQTGLAGATLTADTVNDDLVFSGKVTGIFVEQEGLCGAKTETEGSYHLNLTVTGTSEGAASTGITITH